MKHVMVIALLVGIPLWASFGIAADAGKKQVLQKADPDMPPHVVKTQPAFSEKNVDFALKEIKVTFDRPMQRENSWSWILHRKLGVYPGYRSSAGPRWEADGRTCVLPVRLSPDTLYAIGVNSFRHTGFKDTNGKVAVPHVWVFKTRKAK